MGVAAAAADMVAAAGSRPQAHTSRRAVEGQGYGRVQGQVRLRVA